VQEGGVSEASHLCSVEGGDDGMLGVHARGPSSVVAGGADAGKEMG
jgi:hypothetical protein